MSNAGVSQQVKHIYQFLLGVAACGAWGVVYNLEKFCHSGSGNSLPILSQQIATIQRAVRLRVHECALAGESFSDYGDKCTDGLDTSEVDRGSEMIELSFSGNGGNPKDLSSEETYSGQHMAKARWTCGFMSVLCRTPYNNSAAHGFYFRNICNEQYCFPYGRRLCP